MKKFNEIWGINDNNPISILYQYTPKFFSWLEYLTLVIAISTLAIITDHNAFIALSFISTSIFVFYTQFCTITVLRFGFQKVRSEEKMKSTTGVLFIILYVVLWIIATYSLNEIGNGIATAIAQQIKS